MNERYLRELVLGILNGQDHPISPEAITERAKAHDVEQADVETLLIQLRAEHIVEKYADGWALP